MSQPKDEAKYLIKEHGPIEALDIITKQLDNIDSVYWHTQAIYCYVLGYCEGLDSVYGGDYWRTPSKRLENEEEKKKREKQAACNRKWESDTCGYCGQWWFTCECKEED
jgi:hypothetical protein